ncbi:hypothetical protein ACUHGC_10440 [Testudinibacter sp. P27/CKL/0425]
MKGKIYKFKKWLTLEDAAKKLSLELEDEISVSDILQLAVDGELKISVYFPHDWTGIVCDVTSDQKKANASYKDVIGLEGERVRIFKYEKCSEFEYIKRLDKSSFIAGVYELKLIGNEKLDLEFELKQRKSLPTVDVINLSGFYVKDKNGLIIERQTTVYRYKEIPFQRKEVIKTEFIERLPELNQFLEEQGSNKKVTEDEMHKIFNKIETRCDYPTETFSYPCAGIGEIEGAFFVIQSEHLNEFIANLECEKEKFDLNNAIYLIGEMIRAVKSKRNQWSQGAIIDEILQQRINDSQKIVGLEKRMIEDYFSAANKQLKAK